jgi:hypothetical protein
MECAFESSGHTQNPNPKNQTLNYVLQHNGLLREFEIFFHVFNCLGKMGIVKWCNFLDSQSNIDVKLLCFRLFFFMLHSFSKAHQMYIYRSSTRAASTHACRRMN